MHKEEIESCLSCTQHAYWSISMPLPNIIKIFRTIKKLWSAQEFGLEICSGEITRKKKQQSKSLSFLQEPVLLELIYVALSVLD